MILEIKGVIEELFENDYSIDIIKEKLNNCKYCLTDIIIDDDTAFLEFLVDTGDELNCFMHQK